MNGRNVLAWIIAFGILSSVVAAQEVTGTILGTATDNTGAVLPGVTITIQNTATSQSRTAPTDAHGRYRESQLPIGPYEVRAELQGFKVEIRRNVQLTVGTELVINFVLELGNVQETIVVTGDVPMVQITSPEVAALVDQKMIQQLPLNARDVQQLAALQPGVQTMRYNTLYGPQLTVSGVRPSHNRFLLNGVDSTGTFSFSPVSAGGILMGVEGLQEFKVLTSDYSAAYGIKQGGVVNMVTKAGTNTYHGSAYHFQRDDKLDARNFFDRTGAPPFNRQQFGGSLGGPVIQQRTFFFTNYEQFRQRLGLSNLGFVPNARAREGYLPDGRGGEVFVGVAPQVVPYLNYYFLPNGRDIGGGIAEYFSNPQQRVDERYVTIRIDHRLSASNALWGVYTGDWSENLSPQDNPNFADHVDYNKSIASIQNVHTFSANFLNTTRVGLNRTWYFDRPEATVPVDKALYFVPDPFYAPTPNGQFGRLTVSGLSAIGDTPGPSPRWFQHTVVNVDTDFNYTRGIHAWKFGGSVARWHDDGAVGNPASRGDFSFASLQTFLQGRPRTVNIFVPGSDPNRRWRNWIVGVYGEDSLRPWSNLTLTAGVRWETVYGPDEADGKVVNLRGGPLDPAPTVGTPYFQYPRNLFAPRVGVNWDVFGDGTTSLRGGGGIFYNQITPSYYYTQTGANGPFSTQVLLNNPAFPNALAGVTPGGQQDFAAMEYTPRPPTLFSYHGSVQRELGRHMSVTISYVGSRGRHLGRNGVLNTSDENTPIPQILSDGRYFWPAGGTRPNPNFGRIALMHFDEQSAYNAVHFLVERRVSEGLAFGANYTYGHCIDDGSDEFNQTTSNGSGRLQYNRDPRSSRGPCSFNNTHSFNVSTTWDLPGGGRSGTAGAILGGWRWSTITTIQSGVPFDLLTGFNNSRQNIGAAGLGDRPDWAPGCDAANAILGTPNQYFNPLCFQLPPPGFLGNVGSRVLIGPKLFTSDWSLTKVVRLGTRRIEIQAQTFNIFNRANFAVPGSTTLWSDANTRVPTAGRITRTITSSRQIQLGARFAF